MKEELENIASEFPFSWGTLSDMGRVRKENQDAFLADPESGLFLVSDGMGGQQAGALASKIVTEVLPVMLQQKLGELKNSSAKAIKSEMKKAILELSRHIRTESAGQTGFKGMGATLVMTLLRQNSCFIANMGDSRGYLYRKGKLIQKTEDHSVVGLLLREGEVTVRQVEDHPARGQLTRYVGMLGEVYPYICSVKLKENDRLLFCTDGLTGLVDDKEIATVMQKQPDPQVACQELIDAANAAGGPDNVTVVIIDWRNP